MMFVACYWVIRLNWGGTASSFGHGYGVDDFHPCKRYGMVMTTYEVSAR